MPKTIVEDNIDILVAGAGLGGTGAAFEARYWGKNKKIVIAEKANIDRSGAVAQGGAGSVRDQLLHGNPFR
jgi:adenylylsulfate reductase subunit A